jgi:hypothetical protein
MNCKGSGRKLSLRDRGVIPGNYLKRLRITMKSLSQGSRCPGYRYANPLGSFSVWYRTVCEKCKIVGDMGVTLSATGNPENRSRRRCGHIERLEERTSLVARVTLYAARGKKKTYLFILFIYLVGICLTAV